VNRLNPAHTQWVTSLRPRGGRHRLRRPRRMRAAIITTTLAVLAVSAALTTVTIPDPPAAASAATVDASAAERVFLDELGYAGLQLTPEEQAAAVEVAREHVDHGHLVGMRTRILDDFAQRIPRLTDEQRDVARVAVEHHFQAVTGRKQ
jgi:hypothetical protein